MGICIKNPPQLEATLNVDKTKFRGVRILSYRMRLAIKQPNAQLKNLNRATTHQRPVVDNVIVIPGNALNKYILKF